MDTQCERPAPRSTRMRIAVIDDDAVFVELMHDLLTMGEGYEVVSTAHWAQSYEFVKAQRPDLIILDLMMGREQTGWAVLDLLRTDPTTADIPVILCSAAVPALSQLASRQRGQAAVEAVAKPFDVDHLLDLIARLLEQHPAGCVK
jgi:twitching motility two-component system response regulator PilH